MRAVVYSTTARDQLQALLEQGIPIFGPNVVAMKRDIVLDTIETVLAAHPGAKRRHPRLGLVVYPIEKTPFVVLYDFDDQQVRVHFILHGRTSLDNVDPTTARW